MANQGDAIAPDDDWVDATVDVLPAAPLTVLGTALGALIALRAFADGEPLARSALESAFPLVVAAVVVALDRWLGRAGFGVRDRVTVCGFSLGGFLAAGVVIAFLIHVRRVEGGVVEDPLFTTLMVGTIGAAAGAIAGVYEVRQRAAVREARRQQERLEEFASVVSHDLRNPLDVARGHLRMTLDEGDPTHLERVATALDRMDELVEDTLSLARHGRVVADPERVVVASVAEAAWSAVDTREATVATETGEETVRADPTRLQELFENLFRNAVEHAGSDVTVVVEVLPDGFYVADDGPGIPPDERDQVIEQGYTTADDGTGLGLAIVRAIADAHDWRVRVGESEDGGARFEFTGTGR